MLGVIDTPTIEDLESTFATLLVLERKTKEPTCSIWRKKNKQ